MALPTGTMLVHNGERWCGLTPVEDGLMLISDSSSEFSVTWKKIQHNFFKVPTSISVVRSVNYVVIAKTIFDREECGTLSKISFIGNSSKGSYKVRVVDVENQNIVAEGEFSNTSPKLQSFPSIDYTPSSDIILEIQIKTTTSKSKVYIDDITIYYNDMFH